MIAECSLSLPKFQNESVIAYLYHGRVVGQHNMISAYLWYHCVTYITDAQKRTHAGIHQSKDTCIHAHHKNINRHT